MCALSSQCGCLFCRQKTAYETRISDWSSDVCSSDLGLDAEDLAAIGTARTPATRLSYALQLCCLRFPGRHLRAGELLPAIMLDHIAEQVGVDAGAIADFARRAPTRYDQLAAIKARFGFTDLSRPARG